MEPAAVFLPAELPTRYLLHGGPIRPQSYRPATCLCCDTRSASPAPSCAVPGSTVPSEPRTGYLRLILSGRCTRFPSSSTRGRARICREYHASFVAGSQDRRLHIVSFVSPRSCPRSRSQHVLFTCTYTQRHGCVSISCISVRVFHHRVPKRCELDAIDVGNRDVTGLMPMHTHPLSSIRFFPAIDPDSISPTENHRYLFDQPVGGQPANEENCHRMEPRGSFDCNSVNCKSGLQIVHVKCVEVLGRSSVVTRIGDGEVQRRSSAIGYARYNVVCASLKQWSNIESSPHRTKATTSAYLCVFTSIAVSNLQVHPPDTKYSYVKKCVRRFQHRATHRCLDPTATASMVGNGTPRKEASNT
eukprot:scaffold798_cov367-Pavlova_lutheri.AAC.7